jgi:hypothetical protein
VVPTMRAALALSTSVGTAASRYQRHKRVERIGLNHRLYDDMDMLELLGTQVLPGPRRLIHVVPRMAVVRSGQ